ncbi:MAG: hypothetical protein Cons2KO_25360 [Congregibacter sp.]
MSAELTEQLTLVVHLLLSLSIIGLIMLQQGKGADMGASFGAGASQTLFGSSGSGNVLTRATAWLVALFFATSFGLAMIAKDKTSAVSEFDIPLPVQEAAPALDDGDRALDDIPAINDELPQLDDSLPAMSSDMSDSAAGDVDLPPVE